MLGAVVSALLFLTVNSSASALTMGTGWTDYELAVTEMEVVGNSGADVFRVPIGPKTGESGSGDWGYINQLVKGAALNGVTILPSIEGRMNGQGGVPTAGEQAAWTSWITELVMRYGYDGKFWEENPSLPEHPITTWEIWNEPNNPEGNFVNAVQFGEFLSWAGPVIQTASVAQSKQGTEVLFGGILSWGNKEPLQKARSYLEQAYTVPGVASAITGVAVHPYVIDSASFFFPTASPIDALKYSMGKLLDTLDGLPGGTAESLWITEIGWPAEGEHSVGDPRQASLLSESFEYAKKQAANLRLQGIVWYNQRDALGLTNWARHCGLRSGTGTYRASWYAFQEQTGAPRWPLPGPDVRVAYVDAGNANTISGWQYGAESGWQQFFLWGHEVAAGTRPVLLRYEGTPHIFFVDASRSNQITEWSWDSIKGWQQKFLETDSVAPNSSPSGVLVNGKPRIYFSDTNTNRSLAVIAYNGTSWTQTRLFGDPVAENSSPSAIATGGGSQAFFVDSAKGNTIAAWTWSSVHQQSFLHGDPVAANSSPSAITVSGTSQVFFVDAAKGNTIAVWSWGSGLVQQFLYGDPVAANSSPSAILNGSNRQIFFANAAQNNTISVWTWGSTLAQSNLFGDSVAANSSPSAVLVNGQSHVYFPDLNTNNSLAVWQWGSTLTQTRLFGHPAAAGSSPGA